MRLFLLLVVLLGPASFAGDAWGKPSTRARLRRAGPLDEADVQIQTAADPRAEAKMLDDKYTALVAAATALTTAWNDLVSHSYDAGCEPLLSKDQKKDGTAARTALASAQGAMSTAIQSEARAHAFGVIDAPKRPPRVAAGGVERHATPLTIDAVLTLAADPEGTATAERAADEIARRLAPWGGAEPTLSEWFVVAGVMPTLHDFGPAYSCALRSAEAALEEAGLPVGIAGEVAPKLPPLARACLGGYASWLRAVEHGLEVPSSHWPPDAVKFRPFADIENPF
jgi:hypothetical protein